MNDVHLFLANIWFLLLSLIAVLYVLLDGFDLGVGLLCLFEPDEQRRRMMMISVGSVWDANETWLVLLGGALFGAFPAVYATALHGLYVPIMAMIFGLILRGAGFEFRQNASRKRFWDWAFGGGSLLTALPQGYILGGLIGGLPVAQSQFAGHLWSWCTSFSTFVAAAVVFGYGLLGATYLIIKAEGELQAINRRRARLAAWAMCLAVTAILLSIPGLHPFVSQRWFTAPYSFGFLFLAVAALWSFGMLLRTLRSGRELAPFLWSCMIFLICYSGLAASLYPYLIPPSLTLQASASSSATLVFMLIGIGLLVPVMLTYNGYQYLVFRGKLHPDDDYGFNQAQDS